MCGIAGLVMTEPQRLGADIIDNFALGLKHRGPDDLGFLWSEQGMLRSSREARDVTTNLMLFHRRLSIIDVSDRGWQPMSTEDGRHHIVFNGEIYNYVELRKQYEERGWQFSSQSDTEVLLKLVAAEGAAALPNLTGMFAFALLDRPQNKLFLARDFFGIKPLYICKWRHGIAFASEMGPLLNLPGVAHTINHENALEYLRYGYTDRDERTMVAGIERVRPGHWCEIDLATAKVGEQKQYWRPTVGQTRSGTAAQRAEEVRETFLQSVKIHLRSDVPLGFFLSGGLDSSSILLASRHIQPDHELRSFSYVAPGETFDETRWMKTAAGAARAPNIAAPITGSQFRADFLPWLDAQGEPVGASNVYAGYHVSRLARENGVTVCLDGQGADEVCGGGYPMVTASRIAHLVRSGHLLRAARVLKASRKLKSGYEEVLPQIFEHLPFQFGKDILRTLYGRPLIPAWLDEKELSAKGLSIVPIGNASADRTVAQYMIRMLTDLTIPRLMRYGDRNSMAFSLELRVPYLTPAFCDLMLSQPEDAYVDDEAVGKSLFRSSMRGMVPDAILDRRDKVGYDTPESKWLREDPAWTAQWLKLPAFEKLPYIRPGLMRQELDAFLEGRLPHHHRYFRWINLATWMDRNNIAAA